MKMFTRNHWIMAILLVFVIALIAGCTGQQAASNATVKTGDNISVDYIGWFDNGTIFDTSDAAVAQQAGIYNAKRTYAPLTFVVGQGNYLGEFENGTVGLKVGESRNVTLAPEDAYGVYDPTLIMPVNMSTLTANGITPYVNETLYSSYTGRTVRIDSIPNNTTVMVDFNEPMAGKTLHFKITVKAINSAAPSK